MLGWRCHILYCVPYVHTGAYSTLLDEIVHSGWLLLVVYLMISTTDIHTRENSPPLNEIVFGVAVHRWMIIVGCLSHDFDIKSYTGAYFPIFFEYPWDWDNDRLGFRLSTSLGLPMIYDIMTFLYGLVEIEMDCIRFHLRSIDGFFNRVFMWYFVSVIFTL